MAGSGDTAGATAPHRGMAGAGRDVVGPMVLGAWDAFLTQAAAVDLDRPTRLPGWRAHEVCVHLGCWDDHAALPDLVASARAGGVGTPPDVDATNARVTAAHRAASRDEVLAALRRNREATARYLAEEPVELDKQPFDERDRDVVRATQGDLPVEPEPYRQAAEREAMMEHNASPYDAATQGTEDDAQWWAQSTRDDDDNPPVDAFHNVVTSDFG